jgi:very-short-patch-repair endonuclease
MSGDEIAHRLRMGRLHRLWRGIYAVGRPEVTPEGRWMAAVLACGPDALLSHRSAAQLWGLLGDPGALVEVTVPASVVRRRAGIRLHRRSRPLPADRRTREGIPVTSPATTLIDLAANREPRLEAAVSAADRLELIDPEALRDELDARPNRPGRPRLQALLNRQTFTRTDSELERWFLAIVREAGLPAPKSQIEVNGFRVDFFWPQFGLVVETDGLRYHRTPGQQARDLRRDQIHVASGLRTLRFTTAQVRYEPKLVRQTLVETVDRT